MSITPESLLTQDFRDRVAGTLDMFLTTQRARLSALDADLNVLVDLAATFTAGGKRFRPAACVAGWLAARGTVSPDAEDGLLRAAASLDLLHVSALVHDDVMDGSALRRGLPAAHVQLAQRHHAASGRGDAEAFGRAGAILLGDLLLVWSAELFDTCGLPEVAVSAARPLLADVRAEVTCGQMLDVLAATREPGAPDAMETARTVVELKTSRYTVVRPTQIGASLAGAGPDVVAALGELGTPVGRAFQLRDDLLGVYGDAAATGKPAGDDLREGKRTVLVAHAFRRADAAQRARLDALLGKADLSEAEVAEARAIIDACGAHAQVEADIAADRARALEIVARSPFRDEGKRALAALVAAAVDRDR